MAGRGWKGELLFSFICTFRITLLDNILLKGSVNLNSSKWLLKPASQGCGKGRVNLAGCRVTVPPTATGDSLRAAFRYTRMQMAFPSRH